MFSAIFTYFMDIIVLSFRNFATPCLCMTLLRYLKPVLSEAFNPLPFIPSPLPHPFFSWYPFFSRSQRVFSTFSWFLHPRIHCFKRMLLPMWWNYIKIPMIRHNSKHFLDHQKELCNLKVRFLTGFIILDNLNI